LESFARNGFEKMYEILRFIKKFFLKNIFYIDRNRAKRDSSEVEHSFDLFINTLIVIDRSVYQFFVNIYNMPDSLITNYINIFFCHMINGVNYDI
jgi:hypothetical protein